MSEFDVKHCGLCRGDYPEELVRKIRSAKPMGKRMTADEFVAWLRSVGEEE